MVTSHAVLSIDFESFAHTPAYRSATGSISNPEDIGPDQMERLLTTLETHDAGSTFFVVSEVAERHPERVTAAAEHGHEVASHTHTHRLLTDCTAGQRREELVRSREILESVTDSTVTGFRAPAFDFESDHFDLLAEAGYEYDSSVAPCRSIPGWYGGEWSVRAPTPASELRANAPEPLTEIPIAVMPGLGLPLTGTWLRFFGVRYTLLGMRLLARRGIAPVLYVHPWELATLPPVEGVPRRVYIRTGEWMWRALERILASDFEFVTARRVAGESR